MKIYFIRNTHDEFNVYRGDAYFGFLEQPKLNVNTTQKELDNIRFHNHTHTSFELPMGVHTWLGSGEKHKLTLEEIYQSTNDAYRGGAVDGRPQEMPNDYAHSILGMLESLTFMIAHKMVVTKIES